MSQDKQPPRRSDHPAGRKSAKSPKPTTRREDLTTEQRAELALRLAARQQRGRAPSI